MSRRVAAVGALLCLLGAVCLLAIQVVTTLPRSPIALVLLLIAGYAGWRALLHRGWARVIAAGVAFVLIAASLWVMLADGVQASGVLGVGLFGVALVLARFVYTVHDHLLPAVPPSHAVVIWNPNSGGGKAQRCNLADEARQRGIEPIELHSGEDLVALINDAVARGADGLMAAGGDGTQAIVATIAAEHDLPFACIPVGTRNHFALDLGVDRDDPVGALEAFVTGGEKRVDLADVGGRVFVNNVSMGLYAEAVQRSGYRDAKIRTILDTVPTMLGPEGSSNARELRWTGPDGSSNRSAAVILVSNNVYRLGAILGSGTRPRMDQGTLGVSVIGAAGANGHRHLASEWSTPQFIVDSDGDIPIGVDGEALILPPPLTFRTRPGVLRVRIAPNHPGASPSAALPHGLVDAVRRLIRIAAGANPITLA